MSKVITSFKGFDNDLKCRGFQYEVGKEFQEPAATVCNRGFHACESPLEVFQHYAPGEGSRYCVVEQSGYLDREIDSTKIASSKIKIGAEIGIAGLIKAHVEYVKSKCTNEHTAEEGKPATAGSYGAATAGDSGAATAGDSGAATAGSYGAATAGLRGAATAGSYGAATAGDSGAATAGDSGAATSRGSVSVGANGVGTVRGNNIKIRGGIGAYLSIAVEQDDSFDIKEHATFVIDGTTYKPDTWYTLKNSQIVEVNEEENTDQ